MKLENFRPVQAKHHADFVTEAHRSHWLGKAVAMNALQVGTWTKPAKNIAVAVPLESTAPRMRLRQKYVGVFFAQVAGAGTPPRHLPHVQRAQLTSSL